MLDAVLAALAVGRTRPVEAAVAYAVERNWLEAEGQPVHSVAMTAAGMAMFKRVRRRKPKVRRPGSAGA